MEGLIQIFDWIDHHKNAIYERQQLQILLKLQEEEKKFSVVTYKQDSGFTEENDWERKKYPNNNYFFYISL